MCMQFGRHRSLAAMTKMRTRVAEVGVAAIEAGVEEFMKLRGSKDLVNLTQVPELIGYSNMYSYHGKHHQ